jgi:hypothetical protein
MIDTVKLRMEERERFLSAFHLSKAGNKSAVLDGERLTIFPKDGGYRGCRARLDCAEPPQYSRTFAGTSEAQDDLFDTIFAEVLEIYQ